jgi:hypothetical protein
MLPLVNDRWFIVQAIRVRRIARVAAEDRLPFPIDAVEIGFGDFLSI